MIPVSFEYHRPSSLDEALELLDKLDDAEVLSGGTDLLVDLKRGAKTLKHVISIRDLEELHIIEESDDTLSIGSQCTHNAVFKSALIRETAPEITEAASTIGSDQIRNSATIGGNLCSAASCADMSPPLLVRGAKIELSSLKGRRELALDDFFTGPRLTARKPNEILTKIVVPKSAAGTRSGGAFYKFGLREGSAIAVASVAAFVTLANGKIGSARIALGAVAPVPMLAGKAGSALSGVAPDTAAVKKAAKLASEEASPISDVRGSAEFRRHLVEKLIERAVMKAVERARGKGD